VNEFLEKGARAPADEEDKRGWDGVVWRWRGEIVVEGRRRRVGRAAGWVWEVIRVEDERGWVGERTREGGAFILGRSEADGCVNYNARSQASAWIDIGRERRGEGLRVHVLVGDPSIRNSARWEIAASWNSLSPWSYMSTIFSAVT
jgi:hypothetical protein